MHTVGVFSVWKVRRLSAGGLGAFPRLSLWYWSWDRDAGSSPHSWALISSWSRAYELVWVWYWFSLQPGDPSAGRKPACYWDWSSCFSGCRGDVTALKSSDTHISSLWDTFVHKCQQMTGGHSVKVQLVAAVQPFFWLPLLSKQMSSITAHCSIWLVLDVGASLGPFITWLEFRPGVLGWCVRLFGSHLTGFSLLTVCSSSATEVAPGNGFSLTHVL